MQERWKPVVGYEGLYEVSDEGRVRSLRFGKVKVLSPKLYKNGYNAVNLYKNKKRKMYYVHRLVWVSFRGEIAKGMVVNHLNEIKTDNRLENLEICTVTENNNFGTRNERAAKSLLGNTNRAMQLKLTNAKSCAKYTFSSSCEASEFFGYKHKREVGNLIYQARKRGENFINIRGEKHYFSQAD